MFKLQDTCMHMSFITFRCTNRLVTKLQKIWASLKKIDVIFIPVQTMALEKCSPVFVFFRYYTVSSMMCKACFREVSMSSFNEALSYTRFESPRRRLILYSLCTRKTLSKHIPISFNLQKYTGEYLCRN